MNLKNPELFRSWLIRQLEPICKANPEPVSKYVCALLKKEKSDGELKQSLISQLDIFLESATEEFVNFLMEVLENEKYLTNDANFQPSDSTKNDKVEEDVKLDITPELELEPIVEKEKEQRKSPSPIQAPTPSPPRRISFQKSFSPRPSRRNRFRNERRRIGNRKSRRDNSSHSDSPVAERRTITRKRSASNSSESSTKSPRRSWIASSRPSDVKKYKHRNFNRSPPGGQRSRSTSPKLKKRKPSNNNFRKRPHINSRSNSDDERSHIVIHNKRVKNYQNEIPSRDLPIVQDLPSVNTEPVFNQKQRCIDFEGKGYCARGDMCPFDHGPSPIVLDNNLLNGIVPLPPPVHSANFQETNLYTPQYVNASFPTSKPYRTENTVPVTTRELISIPTVPLPQKFEKPKNIHCGKPSYGHIFSSLPPGVSQTTVELTGVPSELNNIPDLYENFSTFGNLLLIQAKRNGDANTALLMYTNATEAALAFINVDTAVPNVKVAWYADKCILKPFPRKAIPPGQTAAKSYVLKRNTTAAISPLKVNDANKTSIKNPPSNVVKPEISKLPATEVKGKIPEVKRQDPGRMLSDLINKKRNLLEKQLAYRKQILEKMKLLDTDSKEKKKWCDVLKQLNNVIVEIENSIKISLQQRKEYLQKMNIVPMDSSAFNNAKPDQKPNKTSKSSTDCSNPTLLLVNKSSKIYKINEAENNLNDNSDIAEQADESVFEIDIDASILNQEFEDDVEESVTKCSSQNNDKKLDSENKSSCVTNVGNYTRVVISGFENGDEEELIQHFSQFGTILDKEIDTTIPSATLIYNNRKSAENAKKEGRNFQDRLLSVTVFPNRKYPTVMRRAQSYKEFEKDYTAYTQYGGNPYKYKNPQIVQPPPVRTSTRNVYTYRASQKPHLTVAVKNEIPSKQPAVENNGIKLTEEEDLVTFLQKGGIDAKEVEKYMD